MKYSNLAWRGESFDEYASAQSVKSDAPPAHSATDMPRADIHERVRPRPRFERRTIEIRDQGLALFRIR
jgi:hypothetical protein